MPATVQIAEYNGSAAGTKTANVSRGDWLSADSAGSSDKRSTFPIDKPGTGLTNRSYEKWHKLDVTAMGGSTSIGTIRHYVTAALPTGYNLFTSANSGSPSNPSGTTPVNTDSSFATNAMPTSDPAAATIAGTLTAVGESGFVVTQLDVLDTAAAGFERTVQWKYAEVA